MIDRQSLLEQLDHLLQAGDNAEQIIDGFVFPLLAENGVAVPERHPAADEPVGRIRRNKDKSAVKVREDGQGEWVVFELDGSVYGKPNSFVYGWENAGVVPNSLADAEQMRNVIEQYQWPTEQPPPVTQGQASQDPDTVTMEPVSIDFELVDTEIRYFKSPLATWRLINGELEVMKRDGTWQPSPLNSIYDLPENAREVLQP